MRSCFLLLIFLSGAIALRAQVAENITLLCNWNDTTGIRPVPSFDSRYNDVWGFVWAGREYGVIGSTEGAHVIDIADCRQAAFLPGRSNGQEVIHRDYKTYKNYLYAVCDEGMGALQIYDMSYLPDSLHLVYESDPNELLLSHTIFIDTAKAKLYCASVKGLTSGSDYMRVYSLADPVHPVLLDRFNEYDKVHAVYVRNDTAYCSASFFGFIVVDFSVPGVPRTIGGLPAYVYKGYNHSSWINEKGIGIMADETHGLPVKMIDARNVSDMKVLSYFSPRPIGDTTCIAHNPYLVGDYAFISYYYDGLQVYDVSDPEQPKRTGFYDTYLPPSVNSFSGAWGCYPFLPSGKVLVSDMQTGLYVLDVSKATPRLLPDSNDEFRLFPNPANDRFSLHVPFSLQKEALDLSVYDASGRRMLSRHFSPDDYLNGAVLLPLPGSWATGFYFVRARCGDRGFTGKIIKH